MSGLRIKMSERARRTHLIRMRLAFAALLYLGYPYFANWMSTRGTMEVIMSAGNHTPIKEIILALVFGIWRLLVVVLIPAALPMWIWLRFYPRLKPAPEPEG